MSMQSILSASYSLSRAQTTHAVQTHTQGRIGVLKAEIENDGGDKKKEKQVDMLEQKLSDVAGSMMGELNKINEDLKPSEEGKTEEAAKKGEGKEPNTDKIQWSQRPDGEQEKLPAVQNDVPVSYDATGNQTAMDPALPGKVLDATA